MSKLMLIFLIVISLVALFSVIAILVHSMVIALETIEEEENFRKELMEDY